MVRFKSLKLAILCLIILCGWQDLVSRNTSQQKFTKLAPVEAQ